MLVEAEVVDFVHTCYKGEILNQFEAVFTDGENQGYSGCRLELNLKLDLSRVLKKNALLGSFIIGDYATFTKHSERAAFQLLENKTSGKLTEEDISVNYYLTTCPLSRHNIQSIEFLTNAFEHPSGVLVYVKEAHILKVGQPDLYLVSWEQIWQPSCGCSEQKKVKFRFKQSLIDIVKHEKNDLKNAVNFFEVPRCDKCASKMKSTGKIHQIYKNCRKISIFANMKTGQSYEEAFQQGMFEAYVDQNNLFTFSQGQIVDICMFVSVKRVFCKADSLLMEPRVSLYAICAYSSKLQNSTNNKFFGSLRRYSLKYKKCQNLQNFDTMLQNFNYLQDTINMIRFPYLHKDTLTALKYCIINSIFSHSKGVKLNLLMVSDEPLIIQKAICLPNLSIKKFPTIYDQPTLQNFLLACHHSILLLTNPTKKDISALTIFLANKTLSESLKLTLWLIYEPQYWRLAKKQKQISLDNFQIVLDLSFQKNEYVCAGVYQDMIDRKLDSFLGEFSRQGILCDEEFQAITAQKKGRFFDEEQLEQINELDLIRQDLKARKLLQKYFLKSRDYKKISSTTVNHTKIIAEGFGCMRNFLNKKPQKPGQSIKINFLDAILAIFIDEQSCRHRYSSSNTLFANQISKLLLNEENCQLSFWDYDFHQNGDMQENKKFLSKDAMFKRMLFKLNRLLEQGSEHIAL